MPEALWEARKSSEKTLPEMEGGEEEEQLCAHLPQQDPACLPRGQWLAHSCPTQDQADLLASCDAGGTDAP